MTEYTIDRLLVGRIPLGEDLLGALTAICERHGVRAGHISFIGACSRCRLGWYEPMARRYDSFEVEGMAEILHGTGNVSALDGRPFVHVHATFTQQDQRTFGGHVMEGCRVYVVEYQFTCYREGPLERQLDEKTGLRLWPTPRG